MKISYNWLKKYLDLKISPQELAQKLSLHAFEVEKIEEIGKGLEKIVTGEILSVKKHPSAERLFLAQVDVGKKIIPIVFGDLFPIKEKEKLPVAVAPAILPGNIKITAKKIRGEDSKGMLVSDEEMKLSLSEEGLTRLPREIKNGTPITDVFPIKDAIFHLDILPNRAHDCLSHLGVAREIAAILKIKIKPPRIVLREEEKIENYLQAEVKDNRLCPRYTARILRGVKIQSSPFWLKLLLMNCGIRPINNVVDATNFVMLETGQPLHAFDAQKISGKKIIVRPAFSKERLSTLDNEKRILDSQMLVIADAQKALALAGIMGGKGTEVGSGAKDIILESANFNWLNISQTSQKLKLATEASERFSKDIDPNLADYALNRCAGLIKDLASGKILKGLIDIYPCPVKSKTIEITKAFIEKIIGQELDKKTIKDIFQQLGLPTKVRKNLFYVSIPTFRLDLDTPEDLVEEIARIYGYVKIKAELPKEPLLPPKVNKMLYWGNFVKNILTGVGFTEVYNYAFVSMPVLKILGLDKEKHLELKNPLEPQRNLLRRSLIPLLLGNVQKNISEYKSFRLFELAKIFIPQNEGLPHEKKMLSGTLAGEEVREPFYTAKGAIETVLDKMGVDLKDAHFVSLQTKEKMWHPGRSAQIVLGNEEMGVLGELHPLVLDALGIRKSLVVFEVDFEKLVDYATLERTFKPLAKYPAVIRDISIVVPEEILIDEITQLIERVGGEILADVDLFDVYADGVLQPGEKSVAFHLYYQTHDRTLTDKEVNKVHTEIVKELEDKLGVIVRDGEVGKNS